MNIELKRLMKEWYEKRIKEKSENPRKLWKILSEVVQLKKSTVCKSNVDVNALNDHFINTPIDLSNSFANNDIFEDLQPLSDKTFSLPTVSEDKILAHINNMDSKKSIGCDGISSKLLKISSLVFISIIAFLIDLSFKSPTVPMLWKTAYVKVLFKGGKKSDQ